MQSSTIISCLEKCLLFPKIPKILINMNFLHYPDKYGKTQFCQILHILQNSKMSPWWPPYQGECLDRFIARKLKLLQVTKDMELAMGGLVTNGFIIKI